MKKSLALILSVLFMIAVTAGCGKKEEAAKPLNNAETTVTEKEDPSDTGTEASEETTEDDEEGVTGVANPWVDITEEEAREIIPRLFKVPDGAESLGWMKCEDLGDPEKGISPLVQLSFLMDDMPFTARAQMGAAEGTDIAGNFVEWTTGPDDVTLANWGEGNMKGQLRRSINETGYVDELTWYDVEIGIVYSLSVAAKDLDGFDIQAVAESMFDAENEPYTNMPEDFLQEQSGITEFDSYDDVIAALKKGQGYAYIKLTGSDEDILAVTDLVFEADSSACDAALYHIKDGKAKFMGLVYGNGSAYPLRLEDGIIYGGDNHDYSTFFLSEDTGGVMMKDYIHDGVNDGTNEISGFTRETNSFETEDFTGGQEEFDRLIEEREKKPVIKFTVVG
ncbi:MAG: hypothetical protein K5886_13400 [Lachnospiraceae bacterium]|nr:hypothetical protein [Lachnospiraceae bacterium]